MKISFKHSFIKYALADVLSLLIYKVSNEISAGNIFINITTVIFMLINK